MSVPLPSNPPTPGAIVEGGSPATPGSSRDTLDQQGPPPRYPLAGTIWRVTGQPNTSTGDPIDVLVYSDDSNTRASVLGALGPRPHPDLPPFRYVECATEPVVIQHLDSGTFDLAILDGEAVPAGGMGIARQVKDEIYRCPPILVLTGRVEDAWLATWSRADAVVPHPIDPIALAEAVVRLVRPISSPTR
jgi:hypothetical protein